MLRKMSTAHLKELRGPLVEKRRVHLDFSCKTARPGFFERESFHCKAL